MKKLSYKSNKEFALAYLDIARSYITAKDRYEYYEMLHKLGIRRVFPIVQKRELCFAYDKKIGKRVAHVKKGNIYVSLVTGNRFKKSRGEY